MPHLLTKAERDSGRLRVELSYRSVTHKKRVLMAENEYRVRDIPEKIYKQLERVLKQLQPYEAKKKAPRPHSN
jgi:hypothetical protein